MSGGKQEPKHARRGWPGVLLLLLLLAAVGLLLTLRRAQAAPAAESPAVTEPVSTPTPAGTPEPSPAPTPTPQPTPTPCAHSWSDGVCTLCGAVCAHAAHDEEDALCLVCGMPWHHHYENGVCTGCGREPVVYAGALPDEYFLPTDTPGTLLREAYPYNGQTYHVAVWLPYDYSEDVKYNVILLMPGDKSYYNVWVEAFLERPNSTKTYSISYIYDHIAAERLCDPFIVVGISNYVGVTEDRAARWICEGVLPHIAETFSTWAEDGSAEALKAAREHFAIGGLSRGSIQTYDIGMSRCLEYFANFACFSNMSTAEPVAERLNSAAYRELEIRCYYATWGAQDKSYFRDRQAEGFHYLVEHVERLTEGENAFGLEIDSGHDWTTWSTSFFNAIQYLF